MLSEARRPPKGLRSSGRKLWRAVVTDYDLDTHETEVLKQAARTADLLDDLQAVLDRDGPMADSSQGIRAHPAATEARQQRLVLARLIAALGLPAGLEDDGRDLPSQGGARGVYRLKAVP
jgi:hypothetical protein